MVWSKKDEKHAFSQGWSLFTVDSGDTVIQKIDDPPAHHDWEEGTPEEPVFNSDAQAIRFARSQAHQGDKTAAKAIKIHDKGIISWRRWRRRKTAPFSP